VALSTRLHLRFAAATAIVIATVGGALLWYVRDHETQRAERTVAAQARFVERSVLRHELTSGDLAAPVTGARLAELDRFFKTRVLVDGALRVKLYGAPTGVVTYSNTHTLIGTKTDDVDEFHEVLGGRTVRDLSSLNHEGGGTRDIKALEVYVPLHVQGDAHARGVLEIYESYAPVEATVRSFLVPFAGLLLLALLGMWAALFPLVRSMARSLERSRLARHAAERSLEETSEQLRQSQKMDAIGRLAGGVAHDFNNLLLAINGYAEFLSDSLTDERLKGFANEIRSAGERAAALTHQLLAFSRRQVLQPRILNLNDAVHEIELMLRRLIGADITIEFDLDPHLCNVEADPSQIGQVLLNLTVNARDAVGGSGSLTVSTRNDGEHVLLEVADTGEGMDEETRGRIFEPFFTTKEVGAGTGLGLSTVYGIVAQSGGEIVLDTELGVGSTFTVFLPLCHFELEARVASPSLEGVDGHETVLVVEDDAGVRSIVSAMLEERGYEVVTESGGEEAVERFRSGASSIAIVVSDLMMRGIGGIETLERMREIDPGVHGLFMSGYTDAPVVPDLRTGFIQKPFSGDELALAVRRQLDATNLFV
jgi:signal transduction histidine kinase